MDANTKELIWQNLWPMLKATVQMTLPLTAVSFLIGLAIALFVALARMSPVWPLSAAARFYISIIRGTPLLVQLFIIFYGLPQFGITFDPIPAAILSVAHGQWEAAQALGLSYAQVMRLIILPQASRIAVPPLSNTLISLVKDTSLASTILVTELLRTAQIAAAPTFDFFALYGVAAVYYWAICLVLGFGQTRLETRLSRHVARS